MVKKIKYINFFTFGHLRVIDMLWYSINFQKRIFLTHLIKQFLRDFLRKQFGKKPIEESLNKRSRFMIFHVHNAWHTLSKKCLINSSYSMYMLNDLDFSVPVVQNGEMLSVYLSEAIILSFFTLRVSEGCSVAQWQNICLACT